MKALSEGFVPGDDDVLVGRGKKCLVHTGNLRFKQIVATRLKAYLQAECRVDKTAILMEVIAQVRANSPNGGFVKQEPKTGRFYEVGDFLAKEKTAQAFRDALHEYYSSSNPSKKKRRVQSINSSEKKSNNDDSATQETTTEPAVEPKPQTLVSAWHTQFVHSKANQRVTKSEPSSPSKKHKSDICRSRTPPPSFTRFVTSDISIEPLPFSPRSNGPPKRKSSVFLEGTLSFLSYVTENGLLPGGAAKVNEAADIDDPFEPIPLSSCDTPSGLDFA